jgi:hypothetical protein
MATLTEVFPCFFFSCKANARVQNAKTGYGPHSSQFLCCSVYCLFCVVLCIVCVYMCTVLLPPGGYPIAVNKYITSYNYHIINSQFSKLIFNFCCLLHVSNLLRPSSGRKVVYAVWYVYMDGCEQLGELESLFETRTRSPIHLNALLQNLYKNSATITSPSKA